MELRHLRYFLAVAEERHFRRAAENLYISQPALSQQIKQLEEELGLPLFDRIGKRVDLTSAGQLFVEYARRALREMEEAKVALSELQGLQRGELRIGVVQTVNAYLAPHWVTAFAAQYPGIALRIEEHSADAIEEGVASGALHIGVSFIPTSQDALDTETLFTEDLALAALLSHPLASFAEIPLARLDGESLILLGPGYCTRRLFEQALRDVGVSVRAVVEMNSIEGILATVRSSGIPTVLPRLALRSETELAVISLVNPTPMRTVGLLWRRGAFRCAACHAFAAIVKG